MTSTDARTTVADRLRQQHGEALTIGRDCDLPADLLIELDDGAHVVIGDRVSSRRGTTIQAHRGATVIIGSDVAIGENVFISAMVAIRSATDVPCPTWWIFTTTITVSAPPPTPPMANSFRGRVGLAGAPIIIEPGVLISNKTS